MFRTLTPIFSVLTAIAIIFFFVRPLFGEIRIIQDETNKFSEAVSKAVESNTLLNSLLAKRDSIGARELERLEALVPDSINEIQTVIDIQQLSEDHNLILTNIGVTLGTFEPTGVDAFGGADSTTDDSDRLNITMDDFETSDVTFSVIGTYGQLKDFILDLEDSLVITEIVNLSFVATEGELQEYSFIVRSYSLKSQL